MSHTEIYANLVRIEGLVSRVVDEGLDEHITNMAQEELSELKAAAARLLAYGEAHLPLLIAQNHRDWRWYEDRLKRATEFIETLTL